MQENKFLKFMSLILSGTVFVNCFAGALAPAEVDHCQKSRTALSKKARIGIDVAAGTAGIMLVGFLVASAINSNRASIQKDLRERARGLKDSAVKKQFKNNWDKLKYLLGSEENLRWVEESYPEWKTRLVGDRYGRISQPDAYTVDRCAHYENFALMSIAYSLLLAKSENYCADDLNNNELIVGRPLPSIRLEKGCENRINGRYKKITVIEDDILWCAQNHFNEWGLQDKKIGFLNAGDPYDPNGFLPNCGCALEEYLSMITTLVRDLSHKAFRRGNVGNKRGGFYTTRTQFPPLVDFATKRDSYGRLTYDTGSAWDRLTGSGREFYHERGIMSKKVRLIRPLAKDVWDKPIEQFDNFDVPSEGFANKTFCVLSIAGLEDRSGTLIKDFVYRQKWEEITKKQCRFVLEAFIKEEVKVPFLCAFGAGCFGGSATIVAKCFKELLVDEGYADYFDRVVFPIKGGCDQLNENRGNVEAFKKLFPHR